MKPIFYIKGGNLSFAELKILEEIEVYIRPDDRVCLVGKNGSGKSSLLKVITGEYELDSGEVFKAPNLVVGYLEQSLDVIPDCSIYEFIYGKGENIDQQKFEADIILENLDIDGELNFMSCSGGQRRRAMMAKALIDKPPVLLLDEPTNHLDICGIEWLEGYLRNYPGAVITISHDRAFLENVSNKVWWLDRATIRQSNKGFRYYDQWRDEVIRQEESELEKMNRKLKLEQDWLHGGVSGRRKRNQRRLHSLYSLREAMRAHNTKLQAAKAKLNIELTDETKKTKFIIEASSLCFGYKAEKPLIDDFSIKIKRGEKIGVLGANGSGKTSLIKLLIKELKPISGKVRMAGTTEVTYFDQHRTTLKQTDTLLKTLCPGGGDQVYIAGSYLHAAAYLKRFLFDPKMLFDRVSTLSGGQANRLLLAKMLTNPGNLLILDEPTNDLDLDSLEMLLEILADYDGTLIVVSHDRDFIERLVTRTIVFDQDKITDIIGGYNDYLQYINKKPASKTKVTASERARQQKPQKKVVKDVKQPTKLSYKYQRMLEVLPTEIAKLEFENKQINKLLQSQPELYMQSQDKFNQLALKLEHNNSDLEKKIQQWLEVEDMQNKSK